MMIDLFEKEDRRADSFGLGVKEFKNASRSIQYTYNLLRSMNKFYHVPYDESVEPILSLIERLKALADRLYLLRKISSPGPIRIALEGFSSKYIESRLSDDDIVDIKPSPSKIKDSLQSAIKSLDNSKRAFVASGYSELDEINSMIDEIRTFIAQEYVV